MADIKTNQSKVYNALKGMGFSGIGASEQEFAAKMSNPKNRAKVYKALSERGYKGIGKDQAAFDTLIYQTPTQEKAPAQQPAQQTQAEAVPQRTQQPAAQPQKAQQPKQSYKPTDMEMMGFGMTINSAQGAVDSAKESLDRTIQNQETFRKQQPLGGGVAKSAPKFNAETGQMEQTYITSAGTEHTDKNQAEDIQRRLRDAAWREAHPLEAAERENAQDMRDIRMEEERLTERRKAAEGGQPQGWWETFKRNLGASLVTGMAPMGSNVDRDMVEAEMNRHGAYGAERQGITKEQDMLLARRRLAEETQQLLADVRRDREIKGIGSGLLRAGGKVLETALNPRTWDFGEADMASQFAVADAVMKADSGLGLSSNEQKLLDTWAKNAAINSQFADQLSGWTKAGIVTGESLPFMLEMAMNPASGLGEAATAQLMKYSLKKYGTKWVKDHAKSMLAKKIATRLIGDVVGAGVMANTTGLARVAADAQSRMTGQVDIQLDPNGDVIYKGVKDAESPGAAIFKAMASTSIENWSEMAGNYLGFVNSFFGKVLGKSVVGKAGRKMLAETGSIEGVSLNKAQKFIYELAAGKGIGAFNQGLAQFAKRTQWHGVIGEYLEEEIGNIANAAIVGDMTFDTKEGTGVFNLQQNIDTFCGVALMGGFMSALNTVGYVGHRINYDVDRVSNANAQLFGDDLWRRIRTTIDSSISDPRGLNETLTDLIRGDGGLFDENGKKAILKYTQAALEKQGAEIAQYQPRMASSSRRKSDEHGGWEVSSMDKNGDVIETQTFETEDEAKAYEGELKMKQQWQDYRDNLSMTNKLSYPEAAQVVDEFIRGLGDGFDYAETVAAINDPKSELGKRFLQFKTEKILQKAEANRQAIEAFEEENGWSAGTVQWLSEQDPMQLDAEGLAMADQARDFLEGLAYPAGEVHVEHEQQVGADTAQAVVENVISTEEPIDPNNNAGQQLADAYKASINNMTALFDRNEEIKEEFYRLQGMGLSPQEIISSLESFRPEDVQTIIDWYNANARYQSFMDEASRQIDRVAHSNRERRTFHGTINGNEDSQNVIVISDGTNSYTLVSGNVTMDGGGRITGTDSGLIIDLDENGDFVQLGDGSGYSVVPGAMSLDEWEEMERERLQEQVSLVVDPTGAQAEQEAAAMQQPTEQQAGNVGGEAGANTGTGADETPTPAPVAPTIPINPPSPSGEAAGTPAVSIESVTDKDGIKRYENGVNVDDAIADIQADGFDVGEVADASIAEAQAVIDKINGKDTKTRKDLMDRKKAQDVIDYYQTLKERAAMLSQQTERPANGEENVNNQPEQPASGGNVVPSQPGQTVEDQKQERIKALKAELGELFDDDFTKANDVFELVSMWIGRKRNLAWDDVNGKRGLQKELGWTRKIGGDTKFIETLLAKKGEGMGVDEFVHMVWESEENTVDGEKRFDTDEIKNALLDLLKSARSKSDVVDYAVNSRERAARAALEAQQQTQQETEESREIQVENLTAEQIADMEANLPYAAPVEGEDIPDSPITQLMKLVQELMQQEGMPQIKLVDTDRMTNYEWDDIASAFYGGAFVSQEEIEEARQYVLENGVFYNDETGVITVYSDGQTVEEVKNKVNYIYEEITKLDTVPEEGRDDGRDSVVSGTQPEAPQRKGSETPAAGTEGQGSTEPVVTETPAEVPQGTEQDEYLQPRNEKEEQIIADVMAQLQQEIDAAIKERDKAASDLQKAQAKESDRATDMFSDDEAFQEPGQLFSFDDMGGTDRTKEGVNRRTAAERKALQDAQKKLDQLQSEAERNSRIRGALDNERRQTSFTPAADATGTVTGQPQSREEYLASHPLTEEQIMADTEATEDEKLNAIDFLRGEDDSAISRFYYDGIYERAQKRKESESDPMAAIEQAASSFREEQSRQSKREKMNETQEQRDERKRQNEADIADALKEFNDFLDGAKGSSVLDKFMRKGLEGNDKAQTNLLDAFTLTNEAQRMFLKDLLRLASKVGYAYIKSGIHDAQAWSKKMSESIGAKLKEVLGWDDTIISEFADEVWNQKYTVDGVRMRLSEHAERLKNTKPADNSVNVNKQENNEPGKDVSLQQEADLQGDSAEFAERQQKIAQLSKKIRAKLQGIANWGDQPKPLSAYKQIAKELGIENLSDTDLQELIETEVVNLAREIANKEGLTEEKKFQKIVKLYEGQPSLNARDNDRINKQQYSTPAPMAFLMGKFLKEGKEVKSGLEPSAGNGMLTLNLPKEAMHVNDIDEMRLSNLAKQGFGEVTSQDGTQPFGEKKYDVVVTNPPFGSVAAKTYDGYTVTSLEQQMVLNALESMKDDGRAAIIIGGNTDYAQNGTIKGRDKAFLNYLYQHYNVVDVINCDGKALYSRQGTEYNVRMILINGRRPADAPVRFAPVIQKARAERVNSYDELYKRVNDDILSDSNKSAGVHDTASGESNGKHDNGHAGASSETGVRTVRTEGSSQQSGLLDSGRQSVSGDSDTTGSTSQGGRGMAGTEGRTVVGGTNTVVHGTGSASSQSSGSTPSQTGSQRDLFNGRNDSERPDGRVDVSVGAGQRGTGATQSSDGAAVVQQQTEQKAEVKRGLGTEKVPYRKQSGNPFTLQSLMPAEQADVVKKALEDLGDVDQFLVDELGYSGKEELHQALAAEQIDSVAMAIHQMNQGNAFIIGDQTGIGKGRQAAALIRYGVKKGGFPVFITVKKGLFSDMYRDLCDIGSPGLRPFIWSADDTEHSADVTDKNGNVVYKRPSDKEQKRVVDYINKNGKLPPEYDYIITTYDSFKGGTKVYEEGEKKDRNFGKKSITTGARNSQAKRDALEVLAQNSYVIMDESHNAGGEGSAVSGYLQYITTKAKGVTFLSATFAKRPGNMPIYSLKTAIAKAGVKIGELIDAVKQGGATFQEIMSKALTEAGQMIRRERDMTGVTIDWKGIEDEAVIEKQRQQYDTIIGLFNDIIDFQRRYVDPIVNKKNDEAADEQGEVDHTPGTRDMGINNTPFASRTYNMVQQVLLSLKAEETAKRAIEHLKMGHKPVIALANTNEGAADEVSTGEDMEMPDLSVNLKKGLQGTLRITKKDAFGNSTNEMIPFDELSEAGQARYQEIMDAIENASSGLSLSPIDVIKNELKKAGYKVGELTGRKQEFVYNEDGTVKRVKRQDSDKKRTAADFNNGKLDVLILNKSAGTGISLHASSKFDDQRQRVMIVAQAQGDVNDEVQIRGRIDRTGQVLRGMYEYVVSQIPSEQRLLMMLKAKLRSLDANTTSSQKSKFNEMQVQDIINKYGDDIVIQYLAEHTDLAAKMVDPLKWGEGFETMPAETLIANATKDGEAGKTASKVLGRMALLKVAEQEKMLAEIGDLYQAEIDRLNEMGENDLEITEMPLKAKTLRKTVWEEGVEPGGNNPFADNSYVEEVEMDILKKPMKAEEVKKSQARLLGDKTWDEYKQGVLDKLDAWEAEKKRETTDTITARAEKKAQAEKEKYIKGAKKAQEKNQMTDAEIEKNGQYQYDNFYKEEMDKLQASLDAIDKQKQAFVDALETFTTDGVYALPTDIYELGELSFEPSFGKVIDIKISDNFSTAASTISFATLDGRRKITIPISGMVKQVNGEKKDIKPIIVQQTAQTRSGMFGSNVANTLKVLEQNVDNWDKLTSTATRKKGYIITGNLLKALTSLQKQHQVGKLISYTTDTGEIRQGVLMGDRFDPGALTSQNPISSAKADLDDWDKGRKITSADGDVTIKADGYGSWMSYTLKVPKSKKKGEKYFNDKVLLSLMDGQFEGSSALKADFKEENLDKVLKRLDELGVTVQSKQEDSDNDMNSGYSEDIDYTDEEQKIIEQAKSDGTYMKAPNGADSNLTPEQWVRVRTKAFKKWFGDWEKGATPIKVVFAAASHGFSNFAKARIWAKENIARVYSNEETGGKGEISISGRAIEKFLSEDAVRKSDSKDVHMSVLTVLPSVIREGYLAETHPDYKKVDGKRSKENGINPGVTIHRVYGAVSIDKKVYRVKITLKEDRTQDVKTRAYSYEATKIELLDGQSATPVGVPRNSNNSILLAKLLKGVEKSYEKGEKIIDSSQIIDENGEPKVVYHGSPYGGIEVFDHTKGRSSGLKEFGSFFTDNIIVAGTYRDQRELSEELDQQIDTEIAVLEERLNQARNIREYDAIEKELEKLRRSRSPRIYSVFLNLRNPKEFDAKGKDGWSGWHELKQDVGYDIKSGTEAIEAISGNNKAAIMNETYDGIIAHNIADIHSTGDVTEYLGDAILVFKPNQIKSATDNNGEYDINNPNHGYSEGEAETKPQPTRHKENIRKHVENLLNKLGTRNRTTVITSINGIRNKARREHIENMHKQGKKVYGWFENGRIYLYLPDIDSIYKAEQTIWHETVAHVGLRELLGAENYGKLLNRLWMQHKDGEMGEWVTRRMQVNGWSLHKAIDEWLAREAEKVVAERQGRRTLWQKLAGWVGDILREIGYRTNPTITDVRYLFWLSENQLREGEPMSAIKRAAFLHRLDLENRTAALQRSTKRGSDMDAGYSEDIDDPMEYSEKAVYDERLNRVETVFTEAYQDSMIALKTAQNAIAHDKDIPDSQNAYMAENLMHGKNKNEMDLFNKMFRDPLIATINKIMDATGMNWGDVDRYVYTKSGLERNREFFVRDWLERERNKNIRKYEDLNPEEQDIFNRKAETIETLFEDGDIETEEQKEKELAKALQEAHREYVDSIEERWIALKQRNYLDLQIGDINFADYLAGLTNFILDNIDGEYNPSEHDYSGFRAMYGDEDGKYDEDEIIDELMDTEDAINETAVIQPYTELLWEQINAATQYGLERYREAGMRSDEQIDRVEQMFHWYVPMRGFKEDKGEDMYQYFTGKDKAKSYVGGLLKHAKGRGSEANYPISTIFAMTYKAISDCNQNLVNQKLYRLCQANPNDLVVLSDSWARLNETTGEWEEVAPEIGDDMSEEEIREATLAFEEEMRQLAADDKAQKIKGKEHFDYKPMDKKKKSEHIVEVRINGQQKRMIVVGNPRMAQALNGQLRFEHGRNVFSKWNATIKNFMASVFTSYSPTFALRNMARDWTHFRMMLGVREGHGYASQANKYYRQSLFKMVGLFKKYREGRLDESIEMERDFKDFMDNGGITGFVFMQKLDDIQKDMENIYKKQKAGKPIRLNNTLWEKVLGAVEALNEGIENNARFATYRASRHYAGRTKARSAYDAKEITVNFNRKGAGSKTYGFKSQSKRVEDAAKAFGVTSQVLGEGRIFFNATVQAIATTFKNFRNADGSLNKGYIAKWAGKYALPPFMFGLALPMINKALAAVFGGDDDDEPYANLPEWTRRRNLCFYIGHGNFITIPIGQELAAFLTLGDIAAGNTYAPDLKPVDKSWDDEIVGVMNTFSPVDISTKITKGGLMEDPISEVTGRTFSVLAPLVAVEQNLAWTGRPIYREDKFGNDQYTPEYQMVYSGTNPVLVNASKLLHEIGGGDDIVRGKFEVNPAIIQYLWEQYTGGPGKVFSNTISIGKDAKDILSSNESDFNIRKVEGLKAFVQQGDDRTEYYRANAKYRKYKEDAERLYDAVKGYEGGAAENPEYVLKLEQISKGEDFVRMQIVREADKQLSQINKAANKAEGVERKELRRLYNQQVKAVVDMLDNVGE